MFRAQWAYARESSNLSFGIPWETRVTRNRVTRFFAPKNPLLSKIKAQITHYIALRGTIWTAHKVLFKSTYFLKFLASSKSASCLTQIKKAYLRVIQRLIQILNNIIRIFQSHRHACVVRWNTLFRITRATVPKDQGFHIAKTEPRFAHV